MDRDDAIRQIRTALRNRSGTSWSVTGGTGTSWNWLTIDVMPRDRKYGLDGSPGGQYMSLGKREQLAQLLGLEYVGAQGVSVPGQSDYYAEFIDRANGREPATKGVPQWD